jgi:hypothetical protein
VSDLYTAGFASTTGFNLGLNNNGSTDCLCGSFGFFWGVCDATCENRNTVLLEEIARLIFK